jgi:hypothetical protein
MPIVSDIGEKGRNNFLNSGRDEWPLYRADIVWLLSCAPLYSLVLAEYILALARVSHQQLTVFLKRP